jgi:hypothetical protein
MPKPTPTKNQPKKTSNFTNLSAILGTLFFISGILVFIFQIFDYFQNGFWPDASLLAWLKQAGIAWALNPNANPTLHKILQYIPFSLLLVVIGVCLHNTHD